MVKIGNTEYTTFDDLWNDPTMFTEEDKEQINIEIARMDKRIKARELKKKLIEANKIKELVQKELSNYSEVNSLKLLRLLNYTRMLGYTLEVVPADEILKKRLTKKKMKITI